MFERWEHAITPDLIYISSIKYFLVNSFFLRTSSYRFIENPLADKNYN